jgi:hypothetical protein
MGPKRRTDRCENLARERCGLSLRVVQGVSEQASSAARSERSSVVLTQFS